MMGIQAISAWMKTKYLWGMCYWMVLQEPLFINVTYHEPLMKLEL